jgi:hypothetical protein
MHVTSLVGKKFCKNVKIELEVYFFLFCHKAIDYSRLRLPFFKKSDHDYLIGRLHSSDFNLIVEIQVMTLLDNIYILIEYNNIIRKTNTKKMFFK